MSFKSLVTALSEQRQEIKQSLTLFPYFDTWDNKVIAECCQLSKIIEFAPDEIILGSGATNSHMTFFILEGVCKIIHHLHVRVKVDSYGKTTYKLYNSEEGGSSSSRAGNAGYTSLLFNQKHDFQREEEVVGMEITGKALIPRTPSDETRGNNVLPDIAEEVNIEETDYESEENSANGVEDSPLPATIETNSKEQSKQMDKNITGEEQDDVQKSEDESVADDGRNYSELVSSEEVSSVYLVKEEKNARIVGTENANVNDNLQIDDDQIEEKASSPKQEETLDEAYHMEQHLKVFEKCKAKSKQLVKLVTEKSAPEMPKDVQSFFVQVALFYKGACFGLEENLKDTFIMSATKVRCLRIPRRFLLQHNPCNIWNRIRLFFSLYLPPEKQILEYLTSNRKWNSMKRKKSEEILSLKNIPNYILCSEVPFSIRLHEMPRCRHHTNEIQNPDM